MRTPTAVPAPTDLAVEHDLVHQRLGPGHEAEPQAGRHNLGERVKAEDAAVFVHGKEAGRLGGAKLQKVVRVCRRGASRMVATLPEVSAHSAPSLHPCAVAAVS